MSVDSSLLSSIDYTNENETIKNGELIDENSPLEVEDNESLFDLIYNYLFDFDWLKQLLIEEPNILEYSREYGLLRLSPTTRQRLNIQVLLVTLGKTTILKLCLLILNETSTNL
jgi:hypothetical protein